MDYDELERATGKIFLTLLPTMLSTIITIWVGLRVVDWLLGQWDAARLSNYHRQHLGDE